MEKVEPRTLAGFMELLPNEQILFEQMKNTIEQTYRQYGFLPIDTPIIELSDVLLAKAGGETEKCLFSGDTMFSGTWGRTDLPTSNREDIMKSITEQLLKLPDETIVYPGHGKPTRIGDEKIIYLELKPKQ